MASFCLVYLSGKWYYFCQNSSNLGFLVKTSSDDNRGIPGRGLFCSNKNTSPFKELRILLFLGIFFGKLRICVKIRTLVPISNTNIQYPIPMQYPIPTPPWPASLGGVGGLVRAPVRAAPPHPPAINASFSQK